MQYQIARATLLLVAAVALLAACMTPHEIAWRDLVKGGNVNRFDPVGTPPDDAGDHSFVRQAVPVLLGRKVRGHDELKFHVDLIRQTDRSQWVRMLIGDSSPFRAEYIEHWSEFFVSRLRMHRETERSLTSCFAPQRTGVPGPSLATCIAGNGPGTDCASGQAFSMGDVLRSAIAADRLEPLYRAYVFPLVQRPANGADATPLNKRTSIGETFNHVYLHRNLDCLGCHTTWASVSGASTFWNRHHPIAAPLEAAVYGNDAGRNVNEAFAPFRFDGVVGSGSAPWGMSSCGTFRAEASLSDDPETQPDGTPVNAFFTRDLGRRASVWTVEAKLREGKNLLASHGLRRGRLVADLGSSCTDHCVGVTSPPAITEPAMEVKSLIARCAGCHSPSHPKLNLVDAPMPATTDWLARVVSERSSHASCAGKPYLVVPGNPDQSCLNHLVKTDVMSATPAATAAEKTALETWIRNLPAWAGCDPGEPSVCAPSNNDNPAAVAFLTAANIVDQVWEEVTGNALTIANYYPRNAASREILENLTETVFVARNWSLQELLVRILASEHFNRRAPQTSPLGSAYAQVPVAKPFEVNDPRLPPEALAGWVPGNPAMPDLVHLFTHMRNEEGRSRHLNGVGDFVYRYSAESLLSSTQHALGWPRAPRGTSGGSYPSDALRKTIGQYYQDAEPGFRGTGYQMLLAWEAQQGLCRNKDSAAADWIERVLDRVAGAPSGTRYTHADLAQTMRDWLIADGTVGTTPPIGESESEATLLQTLYGDLSAVATAATSAERVALRGKLRAHCGALLQSPQFLLAGIAPEGLGPRPALRECVDPALCSYEQVCNALRDSVVANLQFFTRPVVSRVHYACTADTVSVSVTTLTWPEDRWDCPRGICTELPGGPSLDICKLTPTLCMRPPPSCRPGCARIDCCGGPLPPIDGPRFSLLWGEGALVELAQGARLFRDGAKTGQPLEKGVRLQAGDWIELPSGAQLRFSAPDGVFQTPKGGAPRGEQGGPTYLQITGASAAPGRDADPLALPVSKDAIQRAIAPPRMMSREWLERQMRSPDRTPPRGTRQ